MTTRISSSVTLTSATIFSPLSNAVIATISDSDHSDMASDFTAAIDWGDGTAETVGSIASLGNGLFDVEGSHTYVDTFNPVILSLNINAPASITLTPSGPVTVVDNLIPEVINVDARVGQLFNGVVTVFADSIPNDPSSIGDLSAVIDWGDGTATVGTVIELGNSGMFEVVGSNTYASGGSKPVSVTMTETEGMAFFETTATGFANVEPYPPPPAGTTANMIMNNPSNGDYEIYDVGSNAILAANALDQLPTGLAFAALGTFQAGDTSDMLLRNSSTGAFDAYYISGDSITGTALVGTVELSWNYAGTGDFDGTSTLTELLLRNSTSGAFELYHIAGGGVLAGSAVGPVGNNFQVKGFGSFSESGTTQMIMQDTSGDASNGQIELYTYQPGTASFGGINVGKVGSNLSIVGTADLLGNGSTQMVMQQNNGNYWLYSYSAATNSLSGTLVGAIGSNFHVVGFGSLGKAGQDEMLMQDAAGDFEVYQYNASENAFVGTSMGAVGAPWVVDGIAANTNSAGASDASSAQLTQAMASFGTAASTSTPVPIPAAPEQSQQALLAVPPHA